MKMRTETQPMKKRGLAMLVCVYMMGKGEDLAKPSLWDRDVNTRYPPAPRVHTVTHVIVCCELAAEYMTNNLEEL